MTTRPSRIVFQGDQVLLPEIVSLGWSVFTEAQPGSLGSHVHEEAYEICYISQGLVEWWVGQDNYAVRGGDVFITFPGEMHGGIGGVMNPCELFWIQVNVSLLDEGAGGRSSLLQRDFQRLHFRHLTGTRAILDCFQQLVEEHRHPEPYSNLLAGSSLTRLLVEVLRVHQQYEHLQSNHAGMLSPAVQKAIDLINGDLAEPLSVQEISNAVNMSTSYFHQQFAQEMGMTPADYRNRQRVQEAKQLLRETTLSITEIAFELGFTSSQYFSIVFKRYTGLTPTAYRKH